ncbi:MAG: hypothetical protein LBQ54_08490 [Planctomycetaceae bacterium]|nr:hypothetical protein [Planctomycetaceae bacterium]
MGYNVRTLPAPRITNSLPMVAGKRAASPQYAFGLNDPFALLAGINRRKNEKRITMKATASQRLGAYWDPTPMRWPAAASRTGASRLGDSCLES